jgi:hypothetical protein
MHLGACAQFAVSMTIPTRVPLSDPRGFPNGGQPMRRFSLCTLLALAAAGCVYRAPMPMPRYSKVLNPPLEMTKRTIAVVHFDSSKAQVVAGNRTPAEVKELKDTSGVMVAETVALKVRARLDTRVEAVAEAPKDGVDYVVTGKVIQVDPGSSTLRVAGGITSAVFGRGSGGGGGGAFQASGEISRLEPGGKLVRVADFEHKVEISGGTFTSDGDIVRAGADEFATLVANFFQSPRNNNEVH